MNTLHFSSDFTSDFVLGGTFSFDLAQPIYGLQRIRVKKSFLNEQWDTQPVDLSFYFWQDVAFPPTPVLVTIPAGNYTPTSLATAITNAINALEIPPSTWTVAYDNVEGRFSFTRALSVGYPFTEISFSDTEPRAARILGFDTTGYSLPGNATIVAPHVSRFFNLHPIYFIAVHEIDTRDQVNIQMENPDNYNIFCWTHAVTYNKTEDFKVDYNWSERPLMNHWIEVENSINLNRVTITFLGALNGKFYELDLDGSPFYLEMEYQTKDSIEKYQKAMEVFY